MTKDEKKWVKPEIRSSEFAAAMGCMCGCSGGGGGGAGQGPVAQ